MNSSEGVERADWMEDGPRSAEDPNDPDAPVVVDLGERDPSEEGEDMDEGPEAADPEPDEETPP